VNAVTEKLIEQFHSQKPIRAGSLIVTLFGDAIQRRGGTLSLVSITAIMRAFRIGEGLVRTALSRLVQDGLFERISIGRNSFFRLSRDGSALFSDAACKIYSLPAPKWDGVFILALLDGSGRQSLRTELAQAGFGQLSPDLMIAPRPAATVPPNGVICFEARPSLENARRLAARAWPVAQLDERYRVFKKRFQPLSRSSDSGEPSRLDALVARLLLIHFYRRIVLHDPMLPVPILPETWAGNEARQLCATLYHYFEESSESWLSAHATNAEGPLPPASQPLALRFSRPSRLLKKHAAHGSTGSP
jgi:phenylacetic acid degradation operon negative regulatory protein